MRKLKRLENVISMSIADRPKTEGWAYSQAIDDLKPCVDGVFRLYQIYAAADPKYTGKVTVPTLWDRERRTIVNNESSEIIRMFNSAFKSWTDIEYDYYPEDLRSEIDRINELVYSHFNNGVYRAGFARSQEAYEEAARKVFLPRYWKLARERRYLAGDRITRQISGVSTLLRLTWSIGHFKYVRALNLPKSLTICGCINGRDQRHLDLQKIERVLRPRNVNQPVLSLGPTPSSRSAHDRERAAAA
jgi:putative glutathione S-transferase